MAPTGCLISYLDAAALMFEEFLSLSNLAEWTPMINKSEYKNAAAVS
jgi:hypothetical protein